MKFKNLILIALALCLCFVLPVAAVGAYYESKYVATDNTPYTDGCGQLVITTLTHHSLISSEFNLTRINPDNLTFTNGQRIEKDQFDALAPVADPIELTLDHNGQWDDRISPGTYSVFLKDGNGGQPEYALVTVTEGYSNTVVFLGHGVSMGTESRKPVYTITHATYGAPFSFYVTSATYGGSWAAKTFTPGNVDVTSIVNALVKGNGLHIAADYNPNQHYNKLFTDPNHGTVKMLTVNYVANGVAGTMSVSEENDFVLDIPQTNYAEVTDYFKAHLVGNTVSTIATGSTNDWAWLNSFGIADPSVGTVKSITVDYTKDGVVGYYTTNPNVNGAGLTTITLP